MTRARHTSGPLARLRRDQRGASAVEFAMIAPILILLYFGVAEFCQGFMAQKRMGHVAAAVADLVAQSDVITEGEIDDFFELGGLIMEPFPRETLTQRVSSLTRGSDGVVKVDWSQGEGVSPRATGETVVIPDGLIDNNESVIMTESTYDYDSPVDYLMPGLTHFTQTFYLKPRLVDRILYDD